jgi:hypothetical protein
MTAQLKTIRRQNVEDKWHAAHLMAVWQCDPGRFTAAQIAGYILDDCGNSIGRATAAVSRVVYDYEREGMHAAAMQTANIYNALIGEETPLF